jgi:hypothetical protein
VAGGISSIRLLSGSGGIEVDHLQYGGGAQRAQVIPEPGTLALVATGLLPLAGAVVQRKRRSLRA